MGIDINKLNAPTLADKLAAAKAAAAAKALATKPGNTTSGVAASKLFEFAAPDSAPDQIAIVADDSYSMDEANKIKAAREGIIEFMRNCAVNFTAVSILPMNAQPIALSCNLPELAVKVNALVTGGGTPLYTTIITALRGNSHLKRVIAFSDGQPTDNTERQDAINALTHRGIPCDTVYFHDGKGDAKSSQGYLKLQELAERSGGFCIVYDPSRNQFAQVMRHLTSGNRLALAAPGAIAAVEGGR